MGEPADQFRSQSDRFHGIENENHYGVDEENSYGTNGRNFVEVNGGNYYGANSENYFGTNDGNYYEVNGGNYYETNGGNYYVANAGNYYGSNVGNFCGPNIENYYGPNVGHYYVNNDVNSYGVNGANYSGVNDGNYYGMDDENFYEMNGTNCNYIDGMNYNSIASGSNPYYAGNQYEEKGEIQLSNVPYGSSCEILDEQHDNSNGFKISNSITFDSGITRGRKDIHYMPSHSSDAKRLLHDEKGIYGLGGRLQKLPSDLAYHGTPAVTSEFHMPGALKLFNFKQTSPVLSCYPHSLGYLATCCPSSKMLRPQPSFWQNNNHFLYSGMGTQIPKVPPSETIQLRYDGPAHRLWSWTSKGKLKIECKQPLIPVPVVQEIHRRDKIYEIPQVSVIDAVQPRIYKQGVLHDIPQMRLEFNEKKVEIPKIKYIEREAIVPIITGYTHKFMPKWEIRQVPRIMLRFTGKQETVEVQVPQLKYVDKVVEREVVIDTIQRRIPKITEVINYVDDVQYVWKPVEKEIEVSVFVPKVDVSLVCPPAIIVPYPVQKICDLPATMVRKSISGLEKNTDFDIQSPFGTVRVPEDYITQYALKNSNASWSCASIPPACSKTVEESEFSHSDSSAVFELPSNLKSTTNLNPPASLESSVDVASCSINSSSSGIINIGSKLSRAELQVTTNKQ